MSHLSYDVIKIIQVEVVSQGERDEGGIKNGTEREITRERTDTQSWERIDVTRIIYHQLSLSHLQVILTVTTILGLNQIHCPLPDVSRSQTKC